MKVNENNRINNQITQNDFVNIILPVNIYMVCYRRHSSTTIFVHIE